jgi:glucosamine--fructose-6-phosphate aminotransferase (isomerizing)
VIAGSTRMKAGTAHKIVLNLLSTALMVKLGRIHRGLMVHLRATNAKLRRRAEAIVCEIGGCAQADAVRHLDEAAGDVKFAVLLARGATAADAAKLLEHHDGNLRAAIDDRFPSPRAGEKVESAMAREIAEIPAAAERLLAKAETIATVADWIRAGQPRMMVFCGRGSSGHAGLYLRYLFEARLGMLACAAAPSVMTAYDAHPDMRGALFVVVSQSGRSPDLIATTKRARMQGALTLAIVNDPGAPVAREAELVLPIEAGVEQAVAATKTVVLSMIAGAQLVAALAKDDLFAGAIERLPGRLTQALACDWSPWTDALSAAPAAFVAGRGYALGPAREIALKLTESLRLPALGYSAAELRHGPRAAVTNATPLLVLRQNDETASSVDALVHDLRQSGETPFVVGGPLGTLPWIGDDHPAGDPIAMLVPAYRAIEAAVRARGWDPDRPPHLAKVTRTL